MKMYNKNSAKTQISPYHKVEEFMKKAKTIEDKDLQKAVKSFASILRKQIELESAKTQIADYNLMFNVNVWNDVVSAVEMAFISLNHHKMMLIKLSKNFIPFNKVDVASSEYKTAKDLFIHIVTTYQLEFERCKEIIAKTQKMKANFDLQRQYKQHTK